MKAKVINGANAAEEQDNLNKGEKVKADFYGEETESEFEQNEKNDILDEQFRMHDEFN